MKSGRGGQFTGYCARYFSRQEFCHLTLLHSIVSIESTILIFEIFRNGIAVASRQAKMETIVASVIAKTGTEISCNVSVCAALTKTQQI